MNREIKFRGRRINNVTHEYEWVYGYLFEGNDYTYILIKKAPCEKDNVGLNPFKPLRVITETTSQYTGLKDKNGVEMYEGDIFTNGDKNIKYLIEWHDSGFMGKQIRTYGSFIGLKHWRKSIEIIGNIHENPELL